MKKIVIIFCLLVLPLFIFGQNSDLPLIDLNKDELQVGIYGPALERAEALKASSFENLEISSITIENSDSADFKLRITPNDMGFWEYSNSGRYIVFTQNSSVDRPWTWKNPSPVYLYDMVEDVIIKLFESRYEINAIAFSPDDKMLSVGTKKWGKMGEGVIYLFDFVNNSLILEKTFDSKGAVHLKFSNDNSLLKINLMHGNLDGSYHKVFFYDIDNNNFYGDIYFDGTEYFDPELKILAYEGYNEIFLYDAFADKQLFSVDKPVTKRTKVGSSYVHDYASVDVLIQPLTGNLMFIYDRYKDSDDNELRIYSKDNGTLLYQGVSYLVEGQHYRCVSKSPHSSGAKYVHEFITYDDENYDKPDIFSPLGDDLNISSMKINEDCTQLLVIEKTDSKYSYSIWDINAKKRISFIEDISSLIEYNPEKHWGLPYRTYFIDGNPYLKTYGTIENRDDKINNFYLLEDGLDYVGSILNCTSRWDFMDVKNKRFVSTDIIEEERYNFKATTNIIDIPEMRNVDTFEWRISDLRTQIASIGNPYFIGDDKVLFLRTEFGEIYDNYTVYTSVFDGKPEVLGPGLRNIKSLSLGESNYLATSKSNRFKGEYSLIIYSIDDNKVIAEIPYSESIRFSKNAEYIVQFRPHSSDGHNTPPDFLIRKTANPTESISVKLNSKKIVKWDICNTNLIVLDEADTFFLIDLETGITSMTFRLSSDGNIMGIGNKEIFYTNTDYTNYIEYPVKDMNFISNELSPVYRQSAFVHDGPLYLRSKPGLDGDKVGLMQNDMRMMIFERSDEKMQIGEYNDYWYRVAAESGFHGWCYGAFITL